MLLDLMLDQRKFASLKPQRLLKMIVPRREPHCRQGLGELDLVTLDTEAAPALPFRTPLKSLAVLTHFIFMCPKGPKGITR
jgi:hypothetical protein